MARLRFLQTSSSSSSSYRSLSAQLCRLGALLGMFPAVDAQDQGRVCEHLPRLALCRDADSLDWHPSQTQLAAPEPGGSTEWCTVLAQTDGGTCATFCAARGFHCVRGQDNAGPSSCALRSGLHAGGGGGNGCFESWADQVCTCADDLPPPPPPPPPECRADICGDNSDDCCAPGDEERICKEEGYSVTSGGTSSYERCSEQFDLGAIYQCCTDEPRVPLPCESEAGVPVSSTVYTRGPWTPPHGASGVRLRRWTGIGLGGEIPRGDVIEAPDLVERLASYPREIEEMTAFFESPTNVCDNCITELDAVFVPAASGDYAFTVAADDDFRLWLGDSEESAMAAGPIVSHQQNHHHHHHY